MGSWSCTLVLGVQFDITLFDIRRGREGIAMLTRDHFEPHESDGYQYYKKVNNNFNSELIFFVEICRETICQNFYCFNNF